MKNSYQICRPSCSLQNSRPPQLFINHAIDGKILKGVFEHERLKAAPLLEQIM